MYEKLPFDKPEITTKLGTKLFTHIRKEDQQRVIRGAPLGTACER
jgi:hypothetical protein